MKVIKKLFKWLDQHALEVIAGFLLVFIPLYPKWPLTDVLPGYIVRLRLEDLIISFVYLFWLIQLVRKKVSLRDNPLTIPILLYFFIGFLSSISALFISKTVPLERIHIAKLFLHWARRIEYMSLAFIFFSAVKTKAQLRRLITIFSLVVVLSAIYGLGQKYDQWPVYSTMNREFAKGWRLVLTQHARVPSTFAGHYDFAAFTVIALSIITSILVGIKKTKITRILLIIVFTSALISLLLTASRTSFIAYLVAVTAVMLLFAYKKGWLWSLPRWSSIVGISLLAMLFFGDLSDRFAHVLRIDQFKEYISGEIGKIISSGKQKPLRVAVSDDLSLVYTDTDQPPVRLNELPPDVFENIPETFPEATLSATSPEELERISTLAGKPRTYSPTAFTFGLSSAIRFDALWPRAIEGFKKNPLLGSGYSTLIKTQFTEFTEAESTDNDYLRALGETGLLGFLSFFGILIFSLYKIYLKKDKIKDPFYSSIIIGISGAVIGMMVNGLYIDVFEASKVAYIFWALMGILFAAINLSNKKTVNE
ncbi:MAG: O-antigen ligase family protein [Candidatus Omnitrophica bacterium]|nr:O-antigen ligase family protein [Candidatus Omnitrophota bacterium]